MTHEKIAIIDFDGTICTFAFPEVGTLQPDAREALLKLKELGYQIHIHSCRTATYWNRGSNERNRQIALVHNFMENNDLPYDKLILDTDKPVAELYIDDRGIGYRGNWLDVIRQVRLLDNKPHRSIDNRPLV